MSEKMCPDCFGKGELMHFDNCPRCESTGKVKAPELAFGQCCNKAEKSSCVCAHSWECSEHGETHIGTHE